MTNQILPVLQTLSSQPAKQIQNNPQINETLISAKEKEISKLTHELGKSKTQQKIKSHKI